MIKININGLSDAQVSKFETAMIDFERDHVGQIENHEFVHEEFEGLNIDCRDTILGAQIFACLVDALRDCR